MKYFHFMLDGPFEKISGTVKLHFKGPTRDWFSMGVGLKQPNYYVLNVCYNEVLSYLIVMIWH